VQLIGFIETDRNLKVATTNYDTVSKEGGNFPLRENLPAVRQEGIHPVRYKILTEKRNEV